ncbi:MAG: AtpZ/AtpI family protein [Actinomycetota bacterium]|nr:AtpZ/AtpI family protein [Actinomycetota bacterium]
MPRTSDPKTNPQTGWTGVGQAWVLLSELISALAVWGGIGYGLDRWFHTWPVFFAIGMVVGYAGGAYLIYRRGFAPQSRPRKEEPRT